MNKKVTLLCLASLLVVLMGISTCPFRSQVIPEVNKPGVGKVIPLTPEGEYYMSPVFSPDGLKIAFTKRKFRGLWVMNIDGSQRKELVNEPGAGYKFSWSADSKEIAYRFSKFMKGKRYEAIKKVDVASGRIEQLSNFERGVQPPHWSYSTAGKWVSFISRGERKGASVDHEMPRQLLARLAAKPHINKILYFHKDNIWIMNEDGTQKRQLTQDIGFDPVWSPDRSKIVYSKWDNLIVIDPDGRHKVDLGRGINPNWSPDSKMIIYQITQDDGHRITGSDLYITNADGSGKTQLTNTPDEFEFDPSWSPKGDQIVYRSEITGQIYILHLIW